MREREAAGRRGSRTRPSGSPRRVDDVRAPARVRRGSRRAARAHPERASWRESLAALRELLVDLRPRWPTTCSATSTQLAQLDSLVPEVEFDAVPRCRARRGRALKAGDLDEGQQGAFGRRGVNVLDVNAHPWPALPRRLRARPDRAHLPAAAAPGSTTAGRRARSAERGRRLDAAVARSRRRSRAAAVRAGRARRTRAAAAPTRRANEAGGRAQLPSSFFRAAAGAHRGPPGAGRQRSSGSPFVRRIRAGTVAAGVARQRAHAGRARPHAARAASRASAAACSSACSRRVVRSRRAAPRALAQPRADALRRPVRESGGGRGGCAHVRGGPRALGDRSRDVRRVPLPLPAAERPARQAAGRAGGAAAHRRANEVGTLMHTVLERFIASLPDGRARPGRPRRCTASSCSRAQPMPCSTRRGRRAWSVRRSCGRADRTRDRGRPRSPGSTVELADPGRVRVEHELERRASASSWRATSRSSSDGRRAARCASAAASTASTTSPAGFRVVDYKSGQRRDRARTASSAAARRCSSRSTCSRARMLLGRDPSEGEAAFHDVSRRGGLEADLLRRRRLARPRRRLDRRPRAGSSAASPAATSTSSPATSVPLLRLRRPLRRRPRAHRRAQARRRADGLASPR